VVVVPVAAHIAHGRADRAHRFALGRHRFRDRFGDRLPRLARGFPGRLGGIVRGLASFVAGLVAGRVFVVIVSVPPRFGRRRRNRRDWRGW
jgi:hypothetical protein